MFILLYTTYFLLGVFYYYLKSIGMFFILKELKLPPSEGGEDCCLPEFDAFYLSTYVQTFQRVKLP
jgi:hypothetical protein